MKIGLISTIDTNIGDDFIRVGLVRAIERALGTGHSYVVINKHDPQTYYPYVRHANRLPKLRYRLRGWLTRRAKSRNQTRFDDCGLIVQCGAPVIWPRCGTNTAWRDELWYTIVDRLHRTRPVLNLAAGSCYPWERVPDAVERPEDETYLRRIAGYCRVTTVRDPLARHLFGTLDIDAPLIPCSASLAPEDPTRARARPGDGSILINSMTGGGHFDWDQKIDAARWEAEITTLIDRLKTRHTVAFLCHDRKEYDLAGRLDPALTRLWPRTVREYEALVRGAKAAVCNRMHASVFLAGLGIPSVAVCTDTRLLMVREFGLPCHYVKDATADVIESEVEDRISRRDAERDRLLALRAVTLDRYAETIRAAVPESPARRRSQATIAEPVA